jgi:putative sigma-54 modulation protein
MRLTIQFRGGEGDDAEAVAVRAHVERRIGFALARFSDQLGSVLVRLDDVNGPRGGVDKRCRVLLRGPTLGERVVEEVDSAWATVIDRALSVAGRNVARALERGRDERAGDGLGRWQEGA